MKQSCTTLKTLKFCKKSATDHHKEVIRSMQPLHKSDNWVTSIILIGTIKVRHVFAGLKLILKELHATPKLLGSYCICIKNWIEASL